MARALPVYSDKLHAATLYRAFKQRFAIPDIGPVTLDMDVVNLSVWFIP
jgi:hypothetical protein